MKKLILITSALVFLSSCQSYKPEYDLGNYSLKTIGVRNELDGNILVKVSARGTTYEEVKANALKTALNDIFLKGIGQGPKDCIKLPLFQNRQDAPETKQWLLAFFSNEGNVGDYASIYREFATYEQKRDLKYTQNQALSFEVLLKYSALEGLVKRLNP